jgi:hypothetical protein
MTRKVIDPLEVPAIDPCHHMTAHVHGLADGSGNWASRYYTRIHILTCTRCRAAVAALRALRVRLQDLGTPRGRSAELTESRAQELRSALDRADSDPG